MISSGYTHEKKKKKKKNFMYLSKTKMGQRELVFGNGSQYVNCISDFACLPVNCFQSFSCAKKEA